MLWSQRRNSGAHGAENSIEISALAGVEPRTWASSDVATRLPRTPPFSRLLRHAGGYSRTILTPNLQDNVCVYVCVHAYIYNEVNGEAEVQTWSIFSGFELIVFADECVGAIGDVHTPWSPLGLHHVRQSDVMRPYVELESSCAYEATENGARVHPHPHVHLFAMVVVKLFDCDAHGQTHLNAAPSVVRTRLRAARDAVVAVAEGADLLAVTLLTDIIESTKQVVEEADEMLG